MELELAKAMCYYFHVVIFFVKETAINDFRNIFKADGRNRVCAF